MNMFYREDNDKAHRKYAKCSRETVYNSETKDRKGNYLRIVRCVAVAFQLITPTDVVIQPRLQELLGNYNGQMSLFFYQHRQSILGCLRWNSCLAPLCDKTGDDIVGVSRMI